MAGEWNETTLGQVSDFLSGGTPSKEVSSFWGGTIPWVSAKDMKRFCIDDTEDHVTENGVPNGTKLVPSNTVLLLARGMTLLNDVPICVVKRPMTFNQDIKALRPKSGVRNDFLPYLLLGNKRRLLSLVDLAGHGTGRLNSDELKALDILLPPEPEQRAIAHILGTLDEKIELNRRMNETLEAMARALFKSWFIDFDPVRRNAARSRNQPSPAALRHPLPRGEGRGKNGIASDFPSPPGRRAGDEGSFGGEAFDRLFPDSFENSELGEIPKGWKVGTLGEVAEQPRRSVQPKEIEPTTPYLALEHMPRRCIALAEWEAADGLKSNKFEFKRGEILFGKLRPYFHKVGVAPVDGVCSTDIVVVKPRAQEWFGFILGHISSDAFVDHTNAGSTGTKMPRTNWNDMARYTIVIPPVNIAKAFTIQIRSSLDHIIASVHECRTLAALRDTLLPKLISGELRLPENATEVQSHT